MIFCVAFLALQVALIATAGRRANRSYGFRMYDESTSIQLHVSRVLDDGGLIPIEENSWDARDCDGTLRAFHWDDGLRYPAPARLDETMPAPYGRDSAIEITRAAMQWVAAHTGNDCQTLSFVGELTLTRNGRLPEVLHLEAPRPHR